MKREWRGRARNVQRIQRSAKRRGCLLSYSQTEPGRELTQPRKHLLPSPVDLSKSSIKWASLCKQRAGSLIGSIHAEQPTHHESDLPVPAEMSCGRRMEEGEGGLWEEGGGRAHSVGNWTPDGSHVGSITQTKGNEGWDGPGASRPRH